MPTETRKYPRRLNHKIVASRRYGVGAFQNLNNVLVNPRKFIRAQKIYPLLLHR
jgi:hypothetical protein